MRTSRPSQFVFCACQHGAELALKREAAVRAPHLRLAFSRPGFVTFKQSDEAKTQPMELPRLTFARASGWSLGKVRGSELHSLTAEAWRLPAIVDMVQQMAFDDLHVWQRDEALPGEKGFEPGPTPLTIEVEQAFRRAAPSTCVRLASDMPAPRPATRRLGRVLDVVLVEPSEWWIGYHVAVSRTDRWPGGIIPIQLPEHAVSRAYLKMAEVLEWSALPAKPGDRWAELGCAPGGASQALLDRGMFVTGIDPGEVDEAVLANKRFTHVRARSKAVPRRLFREIDWLAADINATPNYTLDAVEAIVTHRDGYVRGLLLTLKLPEWELASPELLAAYVERIQSWGFLDVRLRQLAHHRREICAVAIRSRGQRRRARNVRAAATAGAGRRSLRHDGPHAPLAGPHFAAE